MVRPRTASSPVGAARAATAAGLSRISAARSVVDASILAPQQPVALDLGRGAVAAQRPGEQGMAAKIFQQVEGPAADRDARQGGNQDGGRWCPAEILGHRAVDEELRARHLPDLAVARPGGWAVLVDALQEPEWNRPQGGLRPC